MTWAEPPSAAPNYIFPFMSLAYFSVTNLSQFQTSCTGRSTGSGTTGTATLNPSLSLADKPVYSNNNTDRRHQPEDLQVVQR